MRIMPFMKRKKGVQFAGTGFDEGGGGTTDYDNLSNRPRIGGVTLTGNKTLADLGAQSALTFDNVPTANSDNPVKSGGVASALSKFGKQISNGSAELDDYFLLFIKLVDNFVNGTPVIQVMYHKDTGIFAYNAKNGTNVVTCTFQLNYNLSTHTITVSDALSSNGTEINPTIDKIYGVI